MLGPVVSGVTYRSIFRKASRGFSNCRDLSFFGGIVVMVVPDLRGQEGLVGPHLTATTPRVPPPIRELMRKGRNDSPTNEAAVDN
jgi:hypothetical protein